MSTAHRGLSLNGPITGVGESVAQEIEQEWESFPDVMQYLEEKLALVPAREPEFALPPLKVEDLTTPDSKAYTEAYAQRVAWFGFFLEHKAKHDAIVLELEAKMSVIETRIRTDMRKNNKRVTKDGSAKEPSTAAMEDAVNGDPHYLDLKKKLVTHKQALKLLNARCENLDREIKLTSRQVEIRRQEFDNSTRSPSLRGQLPAPGMRFPRNG